MIVIRTHINSVADPHHFDADPDPTFHFDADPDTTFHSDPIPDPTFQFDADPDTTGTTHFRPNLDPPMLQKWPSKASTFSVGWGPDPDLHIVSFLQKKVP